VNGYDEYSRLCLAIEVGRRLASEQVIQVLMRLIQLYDVPRDLRSDNKREVGHGSWEWISSLIGSSS
jgi:putative transposase